MAGVSAGRNIIIAGHGAQIIEGTYIDQRTINIVVPANADHAWLKQVADIFQLNPSPPGPDLQLYARYEAQLDRATQLLAALDDRAARKHVHIPHDLDGLRGLQKEIDARLAIIAAERLLDFSWLADAPASQAQLTAYRLQDARYGLTPPRVPPIPTRFSSGTLGVYYATCDVTAALFEMTGFSMSPLRLPKNYVFVAIEVRVERLLDLSHVNTREFIDAISPGFYRAIVRRGDLSWSQQLGASLVRAGFDGCIFPSPISIGRDNIVLFLDNLKPNAIKLREIKQHRDA
jgi:hypothetical protein